MKAYILFASLFLVVGCFSYKSVSVEQSDIDRVAVTYPDLNLAALKQGQMLYETHCNNCHGYKNPASKDNEGWSKTVPRMAAKINKKKEVLSKNDQELIIRFLVTMGNKPKNS
jgi:cytochrome c5